MGPTHSCQSLNQRRGVMISLLKVALPFQTIPATIHFYFLSTDISHLNDKPQFHMLIGQNNSDFSCFTWLSTHCDTSRVGCPATEESFYFERASKIQFQ